MSDLNNDLDKNIYNDTNQQSDPYQKEQFPNQNNQYQNSQYQNQSYQNQSYQNKSNQDGLCQNGPYQNGPYQNGQYQNNQSNEPRREGNLPQYSFWAEQMPDNANNQNYNSWGYANNVTNQVKTDQPQIGNEKHERKALKFIIKSICFGLIAGITFIGMQFAYNKINPGSGGNSISTSGLNLEAKTEKTKQIDTTKPSSVKTVDKSDVSEVVKNTMPSIVSINSTSTENNIFYGEQEVEGSGSGIIIGKDDKELLIATNNHVVSGANKIKVTFIDGKKGEAVIKGTDATADLAVISVDIQKLKDSTRNAITVAKLGNSKKVKVGEMSIAIGNALGYGQSVTVGYISAKDRTVEVSDGYDSKNMVLLQTDAAINPGNSGGALLNLNGEVIGINSIKYASNEVEGMGYAIPISRATPIINELKTREILSKEEQGYLGITGNDVTEDVAKSYNMPIGVYVYEVSKNGAAEKAGLLHGDIITAVNGVEITSMTQLKEKITSMKVGTKVKVKFKRSMSGSYKAKVVTVTLGKNPQLN